MRVERLNDVIRWLKTQIESANANLSEAQESRNYGKEAVYQGRLIAYLECLNKLDAQAAA